MGIEIILSILFGLLAMGSFIIVCTIIYKTIASRNWLVTDGHLQFVDLKSIFRYDEETNEKTKSFRLKISYQYSFNGSSYQSDQIYFKNYYLTGRKTAKGLYQHLKNATIVRVYVNPNNPSEAVLVRQLLTPFIFFIILSAFASCCSLFLTTRTHDVGFIFDADKQIFTSLVFILIGTMIYVSWFGDLYKYVRVLA